MLIEEEFLENSNSDFGEVFIAEGDQEVILHLRKYLNPLVQVLWFKVHLRARIKYLDVWPLQTIQASILYGFLQRLCHKERVPLLRRTVSAILFGVDAGDVNFFLGARLGVQIQSAGTDIFRA